MEILLLFDFIWGNFWIWFELKWRRSDFWSAVYVLMLAVESAGIELRIVIIFSLNALFLYGCGKLLQVGALSEILNFIGKISCCGVKIIWCKLSWNLSFVKLPYGPLFITCGNFKTVFFIKARLILKNLSLELSNGKLRKGLKVKVDSATPCWIEHYVALGASLGFCSVLLAGPASVSVGNGWK